MPKLTCITVLLRGLDDDPPVLAALAAQTVASQLEVVVVTPRPASVAPLPPLPFESFRIVEIDAVITTGNALAAGVRAASGPITAFTEEHSWPRPDWAERLLEAHRDEPAAVAWTLENANPEKATSWVHLLCDFNSAVHPAAAGEVPQLPWHHTSYRRDVLLAYGDELAGVLDVEWRVHADLRAAGHAPRLVAEPRSRHWNVSQLRMHLRGEFVAARLFGATRAERDGWPLVRRALYAAAAPAILAVRLRRALADVRRVRPPVGWVRLGGALVVGLAASVTGEAVGYLAGPGPVEHSRTEVELDRFRFLSATDQAAWQVEAAALPRAPSEVAAD